VAALRPRAFRTSLPIPARMKQACPAAHAAASGVQTPRPKLASLRPMLRGNSPKAFSRAEARGSPRTSLLSSGDGRTNARPDRMPCADTMRIPNRRSPRSGWARRLLFSVDSASLEPSLPFRQMS
jgi:hypothetical protein